MSSFKIYSASAGAGKTYQLVRDYLRICLGTNNPAQFMKILAITFTNKAANEMKSRIISQLRDLADPKPSTSPAMLADLCADLALEESELRGRARACLSTILHEYSAFSVSTIDGFTNRLIRSFARDLNLGGNYEVEMDGEEMLQEAIDEMLSGLTEENDTTEIILGFVEEQLELGRSPRPEHSLMEAGKNLFQESAFHHLRALRSVKPSQFKEIIKSLKRRKKKIEKEVESRATEVLEFITDHGLTREHFSRGYVFNYILYLVEGRTDKWVPSKSVQKVIDGEADFYAKSKAREYEAVFAPIEQELHNKLLRLASLIEDNYGQYQLISAVLKNIYGTAIITEIDRQLQRVKDNTNRLPIGEFNKLISEKLRNEPADYLFERLGERYRYFFIDEFQDTSRLQWQNLLPLVNNAMAGGGEVLLVGDAKQSIYRWRGGEVEQFLDLKNNRDHSNKVKAGDKILELYPRINQHLPKNYRSKAEVVKFNNAFFKESAALVHGEDFAQLYQQSGQEIQHESGGYVEMQLLEYDHDNKDQYTLEQCAKCVEIIQDAVGRGISLPDICILVRSNAKGNIVARHLMQQGISVISPDALSLSSSREVLALVSAMETINKGVQKSLRYYFLEFLAGLPKVAAEYPDRHDFMAEFCHLTPVTLFKRLAILLPGFNYQQLMMLSLSDMVYQLCRSLEIDIQANPFLHAFLDQVRAFEIKDGEDLPGFIRWWHDRGYKLNISTPEHSNAVQVMSIHKSKGLEFKLCILAFADWPTEREPGSTRKWYELEPELEFGIPTAWINLKKDDSGLSLPSYQKLYDNNKELVNFDNLNLLYVAFTRAVEELYILGGDGFSQPNQRVYRYLKACLDANDRTTHLICGHKQHYPGDRNSKEPESINYEAGNWRDKLRVVADVPTQWSKGEFSSEIAYGKLLHGLLSQINTEQDVEPLLAQQLEAGIIQPRQAEEITSKLKRVVRHPQLSPSFSSEAEILNEAEILEPGGQLSRPDRVIITNDRTDIIDYKTGKARPEHKLQLNRYRSLLKTMGYPAGNNILAYIGDDIEVEQWQSN